jgi:hypothetical protein
MGIALLSFLLTLSHEVEEKQETQVRVAERCIE